MNLLKIYVIEKLKFRIIIPLMKSYETQLYKLPTCWINNCTELYPSREANLPRY
jgi:hypothetical protein